MGELTVRRWRRYGKDRLYVNTADGRRVGWVDVLTGERVLERTELREAFDAALASHVRGPEAASAAETLDCADGPDGESKGAPRSPPRQPAFSGVEPFAVKIDYGDLAVRKAGQAAREQAVERRRAAPGRSLVARLFGLDTDERAWRIGADGEQAVGERLDHLPVGWTVLHAVPVGDRGADIDHVVIGPAGVFTVNTKHHPQAKVWVAGDTFLVNGHRQPYVRNCRHEAQRAARLTTNAVGFAVQVAGVIAVVGARQGFVIKNQPDGVHVVARERIVAWLLDQPRVLDDEEIVAVTRAARRSTTWR